MVGFRRGRAGPGLPWTGDRVAAVKSSGAAEAARPRLGPRPIALDPGRLRQSGGTLLLPSRLVDEGEATTSGDNVTAHLLRRSSALALLTAGALALAGLTVAPPSYAADGAEIYLIQGLPGRSVDVAVDGRTVGRDIGTGKVAGPFAVQSGTRKVTYSDDGEVLLERVWKVPAGASQDVVLHLPAEEGGKPAITVFRNDLSAVPAGKASLTVAHTARVGKADVRVDGKVLFSDIANGESLNLVVPVQTYKVAIVPAGKAEPVVLGPVSLTVKGGALNRVYAIGDPSKKTMNVAVHVIDVKTTGSSRPDWVKTGTGGQAQALQPRQLSLWS